MYVLDTTNDKLQLVLGGAVTANQLQIDVSWRDITTTAYTAGHTSINSNNTTDVDIVGAPAASTQRVIDQISIYNKDTASATVTVKKDVSGTEHIVFKATLATLYTAIYIDGAGWQIFDASGVLQVSSGGGSAITALTGDVTATGPGSVAATIANDAVTFAKMQNIATDSLIGRDTAGTGDAENILLNATLSMDGAGNLQRAALTGDVTASAGSNTVTVDKASEDFALTGDISPAQITSDQNDYNPTGLSTASVLRLDSDATRYLTGLAGGADGRLILVHNIGSFYITLRNENASSSAANRFLIGSGAAVFPIAAKRSALLQYDSTSSRWRVLGVNPSYILSSDSVDVQAVVDATVTGTVNASLIASTGSANLTASAGAVVVNGATKIQLQGQVILDNPLSPSQITADQNDYNPASLSTASSLRLSTDAPRNVTGLAGGSSGRYIIIHNVGSFNLTLKDESASSSAANRFALMSDLTLTPDNSCALQYDGTTARWRSANTIIGAGMSYIPLYFALR